MPLTNVASDADAKTVTLTAEFDAPVERAWQLYADPRQLEQWWNPPGYPLTITDHDLSAGGLVRAHVSAPDGQTIRAYWRISSVSAVLTCRRPSVEQRRHRAVWSKNMNVRCRYRQAN